MSANDAAPFLSDVCELRRRAARHLELGAVTFTAGADVAQTIELLQTVLATEIVCVLRYTNNAIAAEGINSSAVADEFWEHAADEKTHGTLVAERIDELGGNPNFSPAGLQTRSVTEYTSAATLVEMIKENLIAERIAIEHYQELIRHFGDRDPTTRRLLERLLADEEDHASDMHDLLVDDRGRPSIESG